MVDVDRNGLEVLTVEECWLLLEAGHIGRVAVSVAGRPEIFPINYVVDVAEDSQRSIVFLSAPGTKLAGALLGNSVAFEIDAADPLFHTGWSVVVQGAAAEIEGLEDLLAAEAMPLKPWGPLPKHDYVRITPTSVTGRRILRRHS